MLTSVLTVGTTAVVTGRLAGRLWPDRFGGYMLARRMVNLVSPFCRTAAEQKRDRSSSMAVPPRSWNERNWVHDEKPIVNQGVTAVQYC
jgi:hypothetical protein